MHDISDGHGYPTSPLVTGPHGLPPLRTDMSARVNDNPPIVAMAVDPSEPTYLAPLAGE
jgi:hypothetical protein